MKPKIAVTREVFPEVIDRLRQHFDVQTNAMDTPLSGAALAAFVADCDGIMTTLVDRVDAELLSQCPKLKAVCNIAVGYNNIDVPACSARGIMVTNTPGVLDDTTADLCFALILATARRLTEAEKFLRDGQWKVSFAMKQMMGIDAHHATLGIMGMGRIGRAIARRARGFDMRVIYHNRHALDPAIESECRAAWVSKETLLREADFVVLMVPYSPATHHLIGAAEMAFMKPTAILINTARGGVVDDAALVEALRQGRIAGAGLDVYENEPRLNAGFLELRNVVLTPHIGSATRATRTKMAMTAAENLIAALTGKTPPNLVKPPH